MTNPMVPFSDFLEFWELSYDRQTNVYTAQRIYVYLLYGRQTNVYTTQRIYLYLLYGHMFYCHSLYFPFAQS